TPPRGRRGWFPSSADAGGRTRGKASSPTRPPQAPAETARCRNATPGSTSPRAAGREGAAAGAAPATDPGSAVLSPSTAGPRPRSVSGPGHPPGGGPGVACSTGPPPPANGLPGAASAGRSAGPRAPGAGTVATPPSAGPAPPGSGCGSRPVRL